MTTAHPRQEFRADGNPVSWRTTRWGRGRSYKDPQLEAWQSSVATQARAAGIRPMKGALRLETRIWVRRPASHLGARGQLLKGKPLLPTSLRTGDATNHHKAIEDALRRIAWDDDCQIVDGAVRLRYADGEKPGAAILIETVSEEQRT